MNEVIRLEKINVNIDSSEWMIGEATLEELHREYNKITSDESDYIIEAFIDHFEKTISVPSEFNNRQFKRALAHELTHAFISEYITSDSSKLYTEEDVADFVSRYAFKIVEIVLSYISKRR
jgi:hypothetical protein